MALRGVRVFSIHDVLAAAAAPVAQHIEKPIGIEVRREIRDERPRLKPLGLPEKTGGPVARQELPVGGEDIELAIRVDVCQT